MNFFLNEPMKSYLVPAGDRPVPPRYEVERGSGGEDVFSGGFVGYVRDQTLDALRHLDWR